MRSLCTCSIANAREKTTALSTSVTCCHGQLIVDREQRYSASRVLRSLLNAVVITRVRRSASAFPPKLYAVTGLRTAGSLTQWRTRHAEASWTRDCAGLPVQRRQRRATLAALAWTVARWRQPRNVTPGELGRRVRHNDAAGRGRAGDGRQRSERRRLRRARGRHAAARPRRVRRARRASAGLACVRKLRNQEHRVEAEAAGLQRIDADHLGQHHLPERRHRDQHRRARALGHRPQQTGVLSGSVSSPTTTTWSASRTCRRRRRSPTGSMSG